METKTGHRYADQVHIVSAGKGLNDTFKTALRKYNITAVVVIKEKIQDDQSNGKNEDEIQEAISAMRITAESLDVRFDVRNVRLGNIGDIRDKVLEIREEFENATFFFNLTHGRKIIPLYLLTMAVWIGGVPYYIDRRQTVMEINIPRMRAEEIASNPNYYAILKVIYDSTGGGMRSMRNKDAFNEVSKIYISENKGMGGRRSKLAMGTFSKWVKRLRETKLVDVAFEEGSDKNKVLQLTGDGIFTYKFLVSERSRNSDSSMR